METPKAAPHATAGARGSAPPVARNSVPGWAVALFYALFSLSGFAGLLYQTIWQRVLTLFRGSDVFSVTIIVAAFMAGMGFGSLAGGHLADRLDSRRRLVAFAAAELAIAAFATVSMTLFYDLLYLKLGAMAGSPTLATGVVFLTLLWPTFFMGMTLPLLARALTGGTGVAARRIGGLYASNTLGAALGCLITVWVLARAFGLRPTIQIGAALNVICAFGALVLAAFRWRAGSETASAEREAVSNGRPLGFGLPAWIAIYALSGFVALSLEIVWFRVLGVILKSTSFTFATLLAFYLSGIGLGAFLAQLWVNKVRNPAAAFLTLQAAVIVYAALSLSLLLHAVPRVHALVPLQQYLASYDPIDIGPALRALQRIIWGVPVAPQAREDGMLFATLYGLVPLYLIGLPTLMMGMSFPYLQKCAQTHLAAIGRRVGWLQTANIVGCMLGAALTGLALLHWLGSAGTVRALIVIGGVFVALLGLAQPRGRRSPRVLGLALLLVASLSLSVSNEELWARLHGSTRARIISAEDGSGVSLLKQGRGGRMIVFVSGLGQSELPYGGIHTALGALPVLLHPNPVEVAAIGLGSGDTVFALGGRAETRVIRSIEIVGPQIRTLRVLDRRADYPGLRRLLSDPRIRHIVGDGRAFLMKGVRLDVVEADALRFGSAFAGNLYSREYFELLRGCLKPGGLAVSWRPTQRTEDTFLTVFPHVAIFGTMLIGGNEPIPFDRETLKARLRSPFTAEHYRRGGVNIETVLAEFVESDPRVYGPEHHRPGLHDLNTDLFPRDEYQTSDPFFVGRGR